jgi:hypothetical protein
MTLSDDELTVLLIAAQNQPMIPIGRWEAPTKSLIEKGYLKPHGHPGDPTGHFNNYITDAGRLVAEQSEKQQDDLLGQVLTVSASIGHQQKKARAHAEQIAVQMIDLAELSSSVTGDDKAESLRRWSEIVLTRALEMLRGR